jgi:predicted Zn-ribbon and HTH transcriptional regulator
MTNEKERIAIMSAPNQNRGGAINPLRLATIVLAEILTKINEVHLNKQLPRIYMWNNVGQNITGTRADIEEKYKMLSKLGLDISSITTYADDDYEFKQYLKEFILDNVKKGNIYQEKSEVVVCQNCGHHIGISTIGLISECSLCKSKELTTEVHNTLFTKIIEDKSSIVDNHIKAFKNTKHLKTRFNHLPESIQINKRRNVGLSLDFVGFEGYVVDPKFAISILPHFVAQNQNLTRVTQIQGFKTATNTIPYTTSFETQKKFDYLLTGHIDNKYELSELDFGFFSLQLPLFLIGLDNTINLNRIAQLRADYIKTCNKAKLILLENDSKKVRHVDIIQTGLSALLSEAIMSFVNYDIINGIKTLKEFMKQLNNGFDYDVILSINDRQIIQKIFGTLYEL